MHLDRLYKIRSIAVVGASPGSYFSDRLFEHLQRQKKLSIFPVASKKGKVYRLRSYPSLTSLKGRCDAAFILAPAAKVPETLAECGRCGIKVAVVLDASGGEKRTVQAVRREAARSDMTVLGPASLGYLDAFEDLVVYAGRFPAGALPAGRVSVLADSGGLLNEFFRAASGERRWGIRRALALGEEAALPAGAALGRLADDAMTGCLVLLVTAMGDRAGLASGLDRATAAGKPVVIFPAFLGRHAGRRAADRDVIDEDLYNELLVRAAANRGLVYVASSVDEAAEVAGAMAPGGMERAGQGLSPRWRKVRGKRLAVLSVSAGIGQWAKRRAGDLGLSVPPFSRKARDELHRLFPGGEFTNPVDLSGKMLSSPESFKKVVRAVVQKGGCHVVIVSLHPPSGTTPSDRRNETWMTDLAGIEIDTLGDRAAAALVPVQVSGSGPMAANGRWPEACHVTGLDGALRLIAWAAGLGGLDPDDRESQPKEMDFEAARSVLRGPGRRLSEPSSRRALEPYGLVFPAWELARSRSRAVEFMRRTGGPVNLKVATPDAAPAGEESMVRLGVRGESAVRKAYVDLVVEARKAGEGLRMLGVLVEPADAGPGILRARTHSPCDGSPPVILLTAEGGRAAAGLCPLGEREALNLLQRAAEGGGHDLEPVGAARVLRRLSFFADHFRDVVKDTRCRFRPDPEAGLVCSGAEVVIAKTVN
jgi:acyl-CoA synthetase (NDP forming)